jgi:hypothetical protein
MSETRTREALFERVEGLRPRIDGLIQSGTLKIADAETLERRLGEVLQAFEKVDQDPLGVEVQVATFEVYVARLETPPSLSQEQEAKALRASHWMLGISLGAFMLLVVSNWLSMVLLPDDYRWPKGWFVSDKYLGFTLAGVAINILISLMPRIRQGDWHRKYLGTYAFRILQATVYAAVIYWFVSSLPANEAQCLARGLDKDCWQTRSNIPFQVSGLFVGMFVHLLEGAFAGIGERFVDMISALFASKFSGPRQKAAKNQELWQKLIQLRSHYIEMDKSGTDAAQRNAIVTLFRDALLLLQSNENEQAEAKLQDLELTLGSAGMPAVEPASSEPGESAQDEEAEGTNLAGGEPQGGAPIGPQKDQESIEENSHELAGKARQGVQRQAAGDSQEQRDS